MINYFFWDGAVSTANWALILVLAHRVDITDGWLLGFVVGMAGINTLRALSSFTIAVLASDAWIDRFGCRRR